LLNFVYGFDFCRGFFAVVFRAAVAVDSEVIAVAVVVVVFFAVAVVVADKFSADAEVTIACCWCARGRN